MRHFRPLSSRSMSAILGASFTIRYWLQIPSRCTSPKPINYIGKSSSGAAMQILGSGACGIYLSGSDTEDRRGMCSFVVKLGKREKGKKGNLVHPLIVSWPCYLFQKFRSYSKHSLLTAVYPIALPMIRSAYVRHSHAKSSLFEQRFSKNA